MDILNYTFMQNALWAALLLSIASGIVGALVVSNRLVFLSGGIAHSAYGGVGLAWFLGFSPFWGALLFALPMAALIGFFRKKYQESSDTLIGVLWSGGMATGVLFLDLTPGYKADLLGFLFGNILSVSKTELWMMLFLTILLLTAMLLFYNQIVSVSIDSEYAATRGLPVLFIEILVLFLIVLSVVLMMRATGLILMIALLTVPAAIVRHWVFRMRWLMFFSALLCLLFSIGGLYISWVLDVSSGASIILLACLAYFLNLFLQKRSSKYSSKQLIA